MNARAANAVASVDQPESDITEVATHQLRGQTHSLRPANSDQVARQEVSRPLKESRKQTVLAAVTQVQEMEQEIEDLRKRNARVVEHNARLQAAFDGAKLELNLSYDRIRAVEAKRDEVVAAAEAARDAAVQAARAERDEAVRRALILETIFGSFKNGIVQAGFELENATPVTESDDTHG